MSTLLSAYGFCGGLRSGTGEKPVLVSVSYGGVRFLGPWSIGTRSGHKRGEPGRRNVVSWGVTMASQRRRNNKQRKKNGRNFLGAEIVVSWGISTW